MRDLCEEEVVRHVSVGDVVVQRVDAPSEAPVHRLKRREGEAPVGVVVDHRIVLVVLQEGDADEPPAKDEYRRVVIPGGLGAKGVVSGGA